MARTGQTQSTQASATDAATAAAANSTAQGAIGQANKNISTLDSGQPVAANPWANPGYLGNVNRLQSGALNAATNAGTQQLQATNKRTGGMNTAATTGAIRDLTLQKAQLGSQLSSERAASDYTKNVGYQQQQALAPLNIAQAESPYYSSSIGGNSAANSSLTQFGLASYGPWQAAIQGAGAAAGAALGCWIAEALYGVDDARTHLLRSWLNQEFKETWLGRKVMDLYVKYGQQVAAVVRRNWAVRMFFRPFFELALAKAVRDRRIDVRELYEREVF